MVLCAPIKPKNMPLPIRPEKSLIGSKRGFFREEMNREKQPMSTRCAAVRKTCAGPEQTKKKFQIAPFAYYFDPREEIDASLREGTAFAETLRARTPSKFG